MLKPARGIAVKSKHDSVDMSGRTLCMDDGSVVFEVMACQHHAGSTCPE
jgi:hypothetical protein